MMMMIIIIIITNKTKYCANFLAYSLDDDDVDEISV